MMAREISFGSRVLALEVWYILESLGVDLLITFCNQKSLNVYDLRSVQKTALTPNTSFTRLWWTSEILPLKWLVDSFFLDPFEKILQKQ